MTKADQIALIEKVSGQTFNVHVKAEIEKALKWTENATQEACAKLADREARRHSNLASNLGDACDWRYEQGGEAAAKSIARDIRNGGA